MSNDTTSSDKASASSEQLFIRFKSTESLEAELKQLSAEIDFEAARSAGIRSRFQDIRDELKHRRETAQKTGVNDQPTPTIHTKESTTVDHLKEIDVLAKKIISMEAEQAKLVVEVQLAKFAQQDAEERLALLVRHTQQQKQS